MYQSTNAALYYLIGEAMYFWAFSEGEVSNVCPALEYMRLIELKTICDTPWSVPKRVQGKPVYTV